jgi:hypothetical protein
VGFSIYPFATFQSRKAAHPWNPAKDAAPVNSSARTRVEEPEAITDGIAIVAHADESGRGSTRIPGGDERE